MNENNINISEAEWEIMRVIWTNQPTTGREIINVIMDINDWKEGTVKSLINRLLQKEMIRVIDGSKPYVYEATFSEDEANFIKGQNILKKICRRERGNFLAYLIESIPLAQKDIEQLIQVIESKKEDAPVELLCDCPIGQCHCHLHSNQEKEK